jgi:endoglucanase
LQDPVAERRLQGCKPQKCFVDHIEAYSLNEVTVNWNSALAWIANWAAEKSAPPIPPDNTPPTTPGTPVATNVTATGATLTWAAASDPESGVRTYDVISIEGDALRVVATVPGTSATLTGLRPNTAYRFAVRARNGAELTSAISAAVPVTTRPDGQTYCRIAYQATGWSAGLTANITITNTSGADWGSWTLRFTWPGNQSITEGWSATWTQTGTAVSANSVSWNSRVPAGGSAQAGFNASSSPPHQEPTDFTVNGQPCSRG